MSRGSKKQTGVGAHGKGAGVGANTDITKDKIGENIATNPGIPINAAWTASRSRANSFRIMRQIASVATTRAVSVPIEDD